MARLRTALLLAASLIVALTAAGVVDVTQTRAEDTHSTSTFKVPATIALHVEAGDTALAAELRELIGAALVKRGAVLVDGPSATPVRVTLTSWEMRWLSLMATTKATTHIHVGGREGDGAASLDVSAYGLVSRPAFRAQTVARVVDDVVDAIGVAR